MTKVSKLGTLDKGKPVLVDYDGGFRSRKVVTKLKALGFKNIQHIHRGYMSWKLDTQPQNHTAGASPPRTVPWPRPNKSPSSSRSWG